ncbi:MAG: GIY-YIG nuclease family protein [Alphaproteobacteria bacterium]
MAHYYVYFVTNWTGKVLYIGMTNNLERRIYEHKHKLLDGFTKDYNVDQLVYFEVFDYPQDAIAREKQVKNWNRAKKSMLVERMNPEWRDLSDEWYEDSSAALGMTGGEQ